MRPMAQRTDARSDDDRDAEEPLLTARDVIDLVRQYVTELTGLEAGRMTSLQPTEGGGWIVEVEVVEDRRIPSSSDILGLYEMELDADGQLLSYRRTQRYLRAQTASGNGGGLS